MTLNEFVSYLYELEDAATAMGYFPDDSETFNKAFEKCEAIKDLLIYSFETNQLINKEEK